MANENTDHELGLIEFLRHSELFAGLNDDMLRKIALLCRQDSYRAKTVLFAEGDSADKVYMLQEGIVVIRIQPAPDANSIVVQPVEKKYSVFGWSGLAEPNVYTATAVCATEAKVVTIDGKELMALLEEYPSVGLVVMRRVAAIISARLRHTREHLTRDVHLASRHF